MEIKAFSLELIGLCCKRVIARLDIKGDRVIKGYQFEGLRIVGEPKKLAERYYLDGADEILLVDTVASLYQRESFLSVVRSASEDVYVPITVAGGIRSIEDAKRMFVNGADKVAVNTAAVASPHLLTEIASVFGCQSVVLSIEAKMIDNDWLVYVNSGRDQSGLFVGEWAEQAERLGVGELLLSSVDRDGTKKGMDLALIAHVRSCTNLPIIGSGGVGSVINIVEAFKSGNLEGVAVGTTLHSNFLNIRDIKDNLHSSGIDVRIDQ